MSSTARRADMNTAMASLQTTRTSILADIATAQAQSWSVANHAELHELQHRQLYQVEQAIRVLGGVV